MLTASLHQEWGDRAPAKEAMVLYSTRYPSTTRLLVPKGLISRGTSSATTPRYLPSSTRLQPRLQSIASLRKKRHRNSLDISSFSSFSTHKPHRLAIVIGPWVLAMLKMPSPGSTRCIATPSFMYLSASTPFDRRRWPLRRAYIRNQSSPVLPTCHDHAVALTYLEHFFDFCCCSSEPSTSLSLHEPTLPFSTDIKVMTSPGELQLRAPIPSHTADDRSLASHGFR